MTNSIEWLFTDRHCITKRESLCYHRCVSFCPRGCLVKGVGGVYHQRGCLVTEGWVADVRGWCHVPALGGAKGGRHTAQTHHSRAPSDQRHPPSPLWPDTPSLIRDTPWPDTPTPPPPHPPTPTLSHPLARRDTVKRHSVCIQLECILVNYVASFFFSLFSWNCK